MSQNSERIKPIIRVQSTETSLLMDYNIFYCLMAYDYIYMSALDTLSTHCVERKEIKCLGTATLITIIPKKGDLSRCDKRCMWYCFAGGVGEGGSQCRVIQD